MSLFTCFIVSTPPAHSSLIVTVKMSERLSWISFTLLIRLSLQLFRKCLMTNKTLQDLCVEPRGLFLMESQIAGTCELCDLG